MRVLVAAVCLLMAACESAGYYATAQPSSEAASTVAVGEVADPAQSPAVGFLFSDGSDADIRGGRVENVFGEPLQPAAPRMLIHNGRIRIEVQKPAEAIETFLAQVQQWGGYMQAQQDQSVTVRLPAPRFDAAFQALRDSGRVLFEQRKADDVTEEFVDLGIRLDNAVKSRDRLLEVLQQAEKIEDVLAVEKELRRLTEEIELMEGRRKFLADRVAMATIQAEFQATAEPPPPPQRRRRPSRFGWINLIGAERVMENF